MPFKLSPQPAIMKYYFSYFILKKLVNRGSWARDGQMRDTAFSYEKSVSNSVFFLN